MKRRASFLLTFAIAWAGHGQAARPAAARGASIGLYTDAIGTTCSFSGNSPGLFTPAYVVVRPDPYGVSAVQFAAPVPACLVVDELQSGGSHRVVWEGKDDRGEAISSGVYFYVLDFAGERRTRKLVLLK